ncbi:sensor histidine kinase [Paraclostridium ghonii]|uniref:Sensor histidine kinase YesM n=1 Tax=Paraclostridium ghonii TaxID=29358 RepID=A0ABU0MZS1_9FIRM|nr:sensor histidine kinase [Paeniclostridium ghonii]MDQ0556407.1 sensor histidine kinase YesM [Paeniclostridium ghonii]
MISVIPILLIGVIYSIINFNKMEDSAIKYSENITKQTGKNITLYFDRYINSLNKIAQNEELIVGLENYKNLNWKDKESIDDQIRIMMNANFGGDKEIESAEIVTAENLHFYYTSPIVNGDIHGANKSKLLEDVSKNYINFFLSKKEIEDDTKVYIIVSKQILNKEKKLVGVLLLALNKEFTEKVCIESIPNNDSNLMLIDKNENLVSASNNSISDGNYKELLHIISASDQKSKIKIDNKSMIVSIDYIDSIGWKIVNLIPYSNLMDTTLSLILITTIVLIFIAIVSFILSKIITKSISKPIDTLMFSILNKDIKTKLIDDSNDEYGVLINKFNKMNCKINENIDDIYKLKLKKIELDSLKKEAELSALQKQINPHFLYNTLESIYWNGQIEEAEELSEMVLSLGDYLKTIINKGREYISIKSEIDSINNYIFLQNKRFDNRITCKFNYNKGIENIQILKLVLLPIIDDIVSYYVETINEDIELEIEIISIDDKVKFYIWGQDVELILTHIKNYKINKNLGIDNVNQRLKLYFGEEYGVNIDRGINILIPIIKNQQRGIKYE